MDFGSLLDLSDPCIGVDPGTRILGVALLGGDGGVRGTWSVRTAEDLSPMQRLSFLHAKVHDIFGEIQKQYPGMKFRVAVEDGTLINKQHQLAVIAGLGEVRGLVLAEVWRKGWTARKVHPMSWKAKLSEEERAMPKDRKYVMYWNERLGAECESPDEIDACMVAGYMVGVQ